MEYIPNQQVILVFILSLFQGGKWRDKHFEENLFDIRNSVVQLVCKVEQAQNEQLLVFSVQLLKFLLQSHLGQVDCVRSVRLCR